MIYYVTGNATKFKEASAILDNIEWLKLDLDEVQSLDPKKILKAKIDSAFKYRKGEFIVEDVSFSMGCLNGLPGPFIKWFLERIGTSGLFEIAEKLGDYSAVSSILVGYAKSKDNVRFFEGSIEGHVTMPKENSNTFWDALFMPNGHKKSFAEMSLAEKNEISHRAIALQKLKEFLSKDSA